MRQAPAGAQAALRAIRLLKVFSPERSEMALKEICEILELKRTTTHRLLAALESEAMIERDPLSGRYRLGAGVMALGVQAFRSSDLRESLRPVIEELARETGETATLEILVDRQTMILDEAPGSHLVSASGHIGTRWPLHATATGKIMLAFASEPGLLIPEPLEQCADATITDPHRLLEELEKIRQQGYAITVDELDRDFSAVAAPVRGPFGAVDGVVSVGGPSSRLTPARLAELGPHVRARAAARLV